MTTSDSETIRYYDERRLAYWRGELSIEDISNFSTIKDWTWYPSNETMTILASFRKRLCVGRGKPNPSQTESDKHEKRKEYSLAYYYRKKAEKAEALVAATKSLSLVSPSDV